VRIVGEKIEVTCTNGHKMLVDPDVYTGGENWGVSPKEGLSLFFPGTGLSVKGLCPQCYAASEQERLKTVGRIIPPKV
jgi:hypothetical protein